MKFRSCALLLLASLLQVPAAWSDSWWSSEAEALPQVQVAEAYLEWRSGPGKGYPVTRVSERGERLELVMRKTEWMKVRDSKGREGWVHIDQIQQTLDGAGQPVQLAQPRFDDFSTRKWEAGLLHGDFEGAPVNAAYAGFWMTKNLSAEIWGAQALGDASEIMMVHLNLLHQPFPSWRISPFFTLGVGQLFVDPKATLSEPDNRSNTAAHAGVGLRFYVTDRYFIRAEVKDYKIFTDRATNEEATEWKVGFSIFF